MARHIQVSAHGRDGAPSRRERRASVKIRRFGPSFAQSGAVSAARSDPCGRPGVASLAGATPKLSLATGRAKKGSENVSGVAARGVLRLVVMKLSACSRFVVLEGLHIDRKVLEPLASWGAGHGLTVQDAIQVAICAFNEGACQPASDWRDPSAARATASSSSILARPRLTTESNDALLSVPAERQRQHRVRLLRVAHGVDAHERPLGLGRHHVKP